MTGRGPSRRAEGRAGQQIGFLIGWNPCCPLSFPCMEKLKGQNLRKWLHQKQSSSDLFSTSARHAHVRVRAIQSHQTLHRQPRFLLLASPDAEFIVRLEKEPSTFSTLLSTHHSSRQNLPNISKSSQTSTVNAPPFTLPTVVNTCSH